MRGVCSDFFFSGLCVGLVEGMLRVEGFCFIFWGVSGYFEVYFSISLWVVILEEMWSLKKVLG